MKFGQAYANSLRRRRPRPGDKWHLDEVFIKINGEQKYLWWAVDAADNVLDILVQNYIGGAVRHCPGGSRNEEPEGPPEWHRLARQPFQFLPMWWALATSLRRSFGTAHA